MSGSNFDKSGRPYFDRWGRPLFKKYAMECTEVIINSTETQTKESGENSNLVVPRFRHEADNNNTAHSDEFSELRDALMCFYLPKKERQQYMGKRNYLNST